MFPIFRLEKAFGVLICTNGCYKSNAENQIPQTSNGLIRVKWTIKLIYCDHTFLTIWLFAFRRPSYLFSSSLQMKTEQMTMADGERRSASDVSSAIGAKSYYLKVVSYVTSTLSI